MSDTGFAEQLGTILDTPTPIPSTGVAVTLAVFAVTAGVSGMWVRYITVLNTLFHEAGHALTAVLTGGGVYTIRIHTHDSGLTHTWYASLISRWLTTFAGAATPPLAGLGLAYLVSEQKAAAALLILAGVAAGVLVVARDFVTVLVTAVTALVSAAVVWWGSAWTQTLIVTAVAWLFLICEATHLVKEAGARYLYGVEMESDADFLWDATGIPQLVWYVAWFAVNGWCLWLAAPMLIP